MDEKELDEIAKNLLLSPQKVEVDGQVVENHSAADVIKMLNYFASKEAVRKRAFPVGITLMKSGGGAV